ncbi:MAG: hypothetical protein ACYCX2_06605 [Christensenellales bacterium]
MPAVVYLLTAIVVINAFAMIVLLKDLWLNRRLLKTEPGKPVLQAITSFVIYFLGTFGISDFVVSTVLYSKTGWVADKKLPGTLNTQPLLPTYIMALAYISNVTVELTTLIPCIAAQMVGAYIGPRLSVRLNVRILRRTMSGGLFIAGLFILVSRLGLLSSGGQATGLHGIKLAVIIVCFLILGIMKPLGIGSYPLTMAIVYALGLNPIIAYPLMMGAGTFASSISSIQFIKLDSYARRITLFTSTLGALAALLAVFIVKDLDLTMLQWIVVVVVFVAAFDMLLRSRKSTKE